MVIPNRIKITHIFRNLNKFVLKAKVSFQKMIVIAKMKTAKSKKSQRNPKIQINKLIK